MQGLGWLEYNRAVCGTGGLMGRWWEQDWEVRLLALLAQPSVPLSHAASGFCHLHIGHLEWCTHAPALYSTPTT